MLDLGEPYDSSLIGYTFIDLFAGIGGFRYSMESFGTKCLFSSEWDEYAKECYALNFAEKPHGDITLIKETDVPNHDVLCAGFPCQAFSISGNRRGFEDTRGTLFFDVVRIAQHHKPRVLLLENVKNFAKHDEGKTLQTVLNALDDIGYTTFHQVLNSSTFGLPQRRERIYIVAIQKEKNQLPFVFPNGIDLKTNVQSILEQKVPLDFYLDREDIEIYKDPNMAPDLFGHYPQRPLQIGKVNKGGQGERIYSAWGHAVTQAATTGGPGGSTGLYYVNGKVRKLTPRESSRLQGFPESFHPHPRKAQALKQIGNSVAINVLQGIIKQLVDLKFLK